MARKKGLGKGIDALFTENSAEALGTAPPVSLALTSIEPNREQPRKTFDQKALRELADSIKRNGVLQPLLVRPMDGGTYQLIAGERRWRASRLAGLKEVPVIIRELSDEEAMEIALIENLQREDLNPIEEAEGLQLLIERYSLTQEEAAIRVGRSRPAIANSIRLLNLPEEITELTRNGKISAGHARALLVLEDDEMKLELAKEICKRNLSVREVEQIVRREQNRKNAKQAAKKRKRNIFYEETELAISNSLGRKVKVKPTKKGGSLEIEFYDKDDLKKLSELFEI